MIRPCYRTGSHDGALLASYEEYARLVDAEAAGAHSSAQIMITGHLAPPPTALVAARVRWQDFEWKCTSCVLGLVVGHAWTASSASQRRWCRQCRSRSGLRRASGRLAAAVYSRGFPPGHLAWAFKFNPFWETGRRALDALAMSDPSVTREAQ